MRWIARILVFTSALIIVACGKKNTKDHASDEILLKDEDIVGNWIYNNSRSSVTFEFNDDESFVQEIYFSLEPEQNEKNTGHFHITDGTILLEMENSGLLQYQIELTGAVGARILTFNKDGRPEYQLSEVTAQVATERAAGS